MTFIAPPKTVVLLIIDGFGISSRENGNAVLEADTSDFDKLWKEYPHCLLSSLTQDTFPLENLEKLRKEYMTIGAGREVVSDAQRIDNSIISGNFFRNQFLVKAFDRIKPKDGNVHILCSSKFSSLKHLKALLELAHKQRINNNSIYLHTILEDERQSSKEKTDFMQKLEEMIRKTRIGNISTVVNRSYFKDKEKRSKVYDMYFESKGDVIENWKELFETQKKENLGEKDSHNRIGPSIFANFDDIFPPICSGDLVIFTELNFETAVETAKLIFINKSLKRKDNFPLELQSASLIDMELKHIQNIGYARNVIIDNLSKIISDHRLRQLKIGISRQILNVTNFFNGNQDIIYPGEDRVEIKIDKHQDIHHLEYKFHLGDMVDILFKKMDQNTYDLIIMNISNIDQSASFGNFNTCKKAVQYTDKYIGVIVKEVLKRNFALIITSSHGNAEELVDRDGDINSAFTTNPVPFIYIRKFFESDISRNGSHLDIAPTVLEILGLKKPPAMTGRSLLS